MAVFEVRDEHAVESGEMGAGAWHEGGELWSLDPSERESGTMSSGPGYAIASPSHS